MTDILEPSNQERADLPSISRQYIEDLEAENKRLRAVISLANNSLYGSLGFFLSLHGGPPNERHLAEGVENIKRHARTETMENKRLREALHKISNTGQSKEPDHWKFRQMARQTAREALEDKG